MSQAAEQLHVSDLRGLPGRLICGRVVACDEGGYRVDLGGEELEARRATGCLLEPVTGDVVVLALLEDANDGGARGYVLSVLEREGNAAARLSADGDMEVVAKAGRVRVHAKKGIALGTPGETRITSGRFELVALSTKVLSRQIHALGERCLSEITKVEVVAETLDTIAERLRQKAKRAFRTIEGLDQVRAGNIDVRAKGFSRSHAADQVVTADGLVKIDGKQIHMG